ncbi:MAG: class B sortase [Eubacterium sp.]|nr:class B sortase [Eubacterium sp.]
MSWILFAASLIFFVLAVREYTPFVVNDIRMDQLQKEVILPEKEIKDKEIPKWASRRIDWEKLQKTNPDIVAWIVVPGTKIDYPVLRCDKWNEYLYKDYEGEFSKPGSIFIQPETEEDFSDFHTILFGHNMRNKSMFGSLHSYEKESFWRKHRKIYIYQPGKATRYRIFAAYDCRDGSETYRTEYKDEEARKEWISMVRKESYFSVKDAVRTGDHILTLSTCSNGGPRSSRYVVHSLEREVITNDE